MHLLIGTTVMLLPLRWLQLSDVTDACVLDEASRVCFEHFKIGK